MLPRAAIPYIGRRYVSTVVPKYSDKVYAFPFAIQASTAATILSSLRAVTPPFGKPTVLRGLISVLGILGSDKIHLFPPTSVQALYFPAWLVAGVIRTHISIPGTDYSQRVTTYLPATDPSYYPGTSHTWIPDLVFASNGSTRSKPVKVSELPSDTKATGEITWLPFTRSPFHLPASIDTVTDVAGKYTLKPEIDFLAANPVLIPLYLVRFEHEENKDFYLEGVFDASGGTSTHVNIAYRHVDPDHPFNRENHWFRIMGTGGTRISIENNSQEPLPQDLVPAVSTLLASTMRAENLAHYDSCGPIDTSFMNDLRARPYSELPVINHAISEYERYEHMCEQFVKISKTLPGKQMTFQTKSGINQSSDHVAAFLNFAGTSDAGRKIWFDSSPPWWSRWVASQTPLVLAREKKRQEDRLRAEKMRALRASNQAPKVNLLPLPTKELNTKRKQDIEFEKYKERRARRLLEEQHAEKEASRLAKVKTAPASERAEPQLRAEPERPAIADLSNRNDESPMSKLRSLAADFRSRLSG